MATPGDEHEQGEDEVIESGTRPYCMLELAAQDRRTPVRHFSQRSEEGVAADDPKHVEAAQGIERKKTGLGS